jgi:N-acetyl-gamma-glutamyl-phosphate reductase
MTTTEPIHIAILGGTGFGGGELLRLLTMHPQAQVVCVQSRSAAGKSIGQVHPHLRSLYTLTFSEAIPSSFGSYARQVIFSSLPHGESSKLIEAVRLEFPKALIVDLSGDLRLKDTAAHQTYYPHSPILSELRTQAIYGLSEAARTSIQGQQLIANPGCLATAAILSLLPFTSDKQTPHITSIALHLATGSSGSGKEPKPNTHHPVRHANFYAYKPLEHQHIPEIIESLCPTEHHNASAIRQFSFVPHSLPVSRGILCSAFITLSQPTTTQAMQQLFEQRYQHDPFIRVLPPHTAAELENVVGSNFSDIAVHAKDEKVIVHVALDNLIKGMAGQAIQNMNIALGIPETTGLFFGGLRPI